MRTYEVFTDLDPDALTEIAVEVYRRWLEFALGKDEIGGRLLSFPSGRYAASMSWRRTGVASVALIADEKIAPEAKWIEEGRAGADMKAAMLGKGKTRVSSDGYLYRVIPMRRDSRTPGFDLGEIATSSAGERLPIRVSRLWARPRLRNDPDRFVTMTNEPGSSEWMIPAMPAYSPAAILAALVRREYGGR